MYKLSVPVSLETLTDKDLPRFHETFAACGVGRVFVCCLSNIYDKNNSLDTDFPRFKTVIRYLKERGYEVGVWFGGFGHGGPLSHVSGDVQHKADFTPMEGVDGSKLDALCPLDEKLIACFADEIKKLASIKELDIIMIDDDFRLNMRRGQNMACCCPRHLAEYRKRLGEDVPRDRLEALVFGGGKNRYRDEWLRLSGDTLRNFAAKMREAADSVNPSVRLGICSCYDTWDMDGTDCIELARILAGNTAPYLRTIEKPYQGATVANAVESTRMQAKWCRDAGIEVFTEGDVYPRPRYNVPARRLENFDVALLATGETDGILKYMFDYVQPIDYETGYTDRHIRNTENRQLIAEIFGGKRAVGVSIFEEMHKIKDWELPENPTAGIALRLPKMINPRSQKLFTENAIPTAYHITDAMPVAVFGENARHFDYTSHQNALILDAKAAEILTARGLDVGLISASHVYPSGECYPDFDRTVIGLSKLHFCRLDCAPSAKPLTYFEPMHVPASYLYENGDGRRVYVLGYDAYANDEVCRNYLDNYYRNRQLPEALAWVANAPLPAVCTGHPFLYSIAAESNDRKKLSVLLINTFEDEIFAPVVTLQKPYSKIRSVNCTATLNGNTVTLSDIAPFAFAAFEVEE